MRARADIFSCMHAPMAGRLNGAASALSNGRASGVLVDAHLATDSSAGGAEDTLNAVGKGRVDVAATDSAASSREDQPSSPPLPSVESALQDLHIHSGRPRVCLEVDPRAQRGFAYSEEALEWLRMHRVPFIIENTENLPVDLSKGTAQKVGCCNKKSEPLNLSQDAQKAASLCVWTLKVPALEQSQLLAVPANRNKGILAALEQHCAIKRLPRTNHRADTHSDGADTETIGLSETADAAPAQPLLCPHGNAFILESFNRLPHPDWHELIDGWSCHEGEFKSLLGLEMKPRQSAALVGDFHLVPHEKAVPKCCAGRKTFWFSELGGFPVDAVKLTYEFFREYFEGRGTCVFECDGRRYAVRMLYQCYVNAEDEVSIADGLKWKKSSTCDANGTSLPGIFAPALKVGWKESEGCISAGCNINNWYAARILSILKENSTRIMLLGYNLSYIPYV